MTSEHFTENLMMTIKEVDARAVLFVPRDDNPHLGLLISLGMAHGYILDITCAHGAKETVEYAAADNQGLHYYRVDDDCQRLFKKDQYGTMTDLYDRQVISWEELLMVEIS